MLSASAARKLLLMASLVQACMVQVRLQSVGALEKQPPEGRAADAAPFALAHGREVRLKVRSAATFPLLHAPCAIALFALCSGCC